MKKINITMMMVTLFCSKQVSAAISDELIRGTTPKKTIPALTVSKVKAVGQAMQGADPTSTNSLYDMATTSNGKLGSGTDIAGSLKKVNNFFTADNAGATTTLRAKISKIQPLLYSTPSTTLKDGMPDILTLLRPSSDSSSSAADILDNASKTLNCYNNESLVDTANAYNAFLSSTGTTLKDAFSDAMKRIKYEATTDVDTAGYSKTTLADIGDIEQFYNHNFMYKSIKDGAESLRKNVIGYTTASPTVQTISSSTPGKLHTSFFKPYNNAKSAEGKIKALLDIFKNIPKDSFMVISPPSVAKTSLGEFLDQMYVALKNPAP